MVSGRGVHVDGEKFRELRHACGLTQEEASSKSGYSDRLIRKLERGGPVELQTASDIFQTYDMLAKSKHSLSDFLQQVAEKNDVETLIHRWFDGVFNHRDLSLIDQLTDENIELFAEGRTVRGRQAIYDRVTTLLGAFNPLTITVDYIVCDGPQAVAYWSVTKKHVGPFAGIEPTGRWVEIKGSSFAVFQNGRMVQARDHWDVQDLIQQLVSEEA